MPDRRRSGSGHAASGRPRGAIERRAARNKVIIVVMALLMGFSLIAVPLTQMLASR